MTESTAGPDFDALYERERDRLYRAVVLATNDRDLALAAVDDSFVAMRATMRRGSDSDSAAGVLRRAIRRAGKTDKDGVHGFRMPDAATSPAVAAVVSALRSLDFIDRFVVLGRGYLEWDDDAIGHATGVMASHVAGRADAAFASIAQAMDHPGADPMEAIGGALRQAGDGLSRPLSRLDSIKNNARSRRLVWLAGGVAAVLVLTVGIAAGVRAITSSGSDILGNGGQTVDSSTGATSAVGSLTADNVAWTQVGLPFRQGELTAITAGPDGFVGVGTDWNEGGLRLLRSEDGIEWSIEDTVPGGRSGRGSEGWISDLRYDGDRYIGIGASYDDAQGNETPFVSISDENGDWQTLPIEVEQSIEVDDMTIRVGVSMNAVAMVGDEIVAFGSQYAHEDLWRLVEDALPDDVSAGGGWEITPAGVKFLNERGEAVHTATAEELGIPEGVLALFISGRPTVWRSADGGETWSEEPVSGFLGGGGWVAGMATDGEVMLAVVQQDVGGSALWRSDGEDWERALVGDGVNVSSVDRFGDHFYAVGGGAEGGGVWRSPDGMKWERIGGDAFDGMLPERIRSSPFGLIATGQSGDAARAIGPAEIEVDDLTLTIDAGGRYVVTDNAGETILELFAEDLEYGSDGTVILVDPVSGENVLRVEQRAIDAAWEEAYRELEVNGPGPGDNSIAVAVSTDGEDWVRLDTGPLGQGFYANVAALGEKGVLIAGYSDEGDGGSTLWLGSRED